jgi:hypothetical protein
MVAEIGIENVKVIIAPYDMRIADKHISIEEIDWENELYAQIRNALQRYAE